MKIHVKKKRFQTFCREQVVKHGLINQANGTWAKADSNKWQDNHMRAGYKVR